MVVAREGGGRGGVCAAGLAYNEEKRRIFYYTLRVSRQFGSEVSRHSVLLFPSARACKFLQSRRLSPHVFWPAVPVSPQNVGFCNSLRQ